MKPCYFHPQALLEIEAAAQFYDEQSQGLGHGLIELYYQWVGIAVLVIGSPQSFADSP